MKSCVSGDIAKGLYNFQWEGKKMVRGAVTSHIYDLIIWEAEMIRLQNVERSVDICSQ